MTVQTLTFRVWWRCLCGHEWRRVYAHEEPVWVPQCPRCASPDTWAKAQEVRPPDA